MAAKGRGVLVVQRLELTDGTTLTQASADGEPLRFRCAPYGVVHVTDSLTGKRDGDVDVFPWHTVQQLRTWRARPGTSQTFGARP